MGENSVGVSYQDFAGSGTVHMVGGVVALAGAIALGPRIGRFDAVTGKANELPGHSVALTALGGMILWTGFFAFNGGSQGSLSNGGDLSAVAVSFVNTVLSSAAGGLVAMILQYILKKGNQWSLLIAINGILGGAVAICAGCNSVEPWAAFVIGSIAGCVYWGGSWLMERFHVDDPLDAVPVHLFCGFWGVLAAPLFSNGNNYDGILYSWSGAAFQQFGWNLLCGVVYIIWAGGLSSILFYCLKAAGRLRVSEATEMMGLDEKEHKEPAYPEISASLDHMKKMSASLDQKNISNSFEAGSVGSETISNNGNPNTTEIV